MLPRRLTVSPRSMRCCAARQRRRLGDVFLSWRRLLLLATVGLVPCESSILLRLTPLYRIRPNEQRLAAESVRAARHGRVVLSRTSNQ